ncbi:hypothetical protein CTEN210_08968 [Chaetoceros tenuissimus]|uniref:Uncharacterized protein n=1 Tax=Chaetoceros tenuissimus TaxID=426638 RepID=A0AAD3CUV7_9STRA|nr:hypothetical protein CTEN210_08968 [Chaetoceros tenuissimus]
MKISRSALTLCLLPCATSFAPISSTHYSVSSPSISLESSRTDQGWNNDNFLDALSGNSEEIEKVNEEYKLQSASRQELRSRQLQSMIDQNQDESSQEYLQLLQEEQKAQMQRIQGGNNTENLQPNLPPNAVPDVVATQPTAPATPVTTSSQSQVTPEAMEYYQQQLKGWQQLMQGYAQVLAANPEAAAQMTMPQPPPPPPGYVSPNAIATPAPTAAAPVAAQPVQATPPPPQKKYVKDEQGNIDPKQFLPSGNNKDAYEITNPADVYLAQLKRDSTVRTEARKRGDVETANQVFEDVGVKALNNLLSDELIKSRRDQLAKNGGEFETSRDEMILPYEEEEEFEDKSYTGISYKEKLMEMKKKRAGGSNTE